MNKRGSIRESCLTFSGLPEPQSQDVSNDSINLFIQEEGFEDEDYFPVAAPPKEDDEDEASPAGYDDPNAEIATISESLGLSMADSYLLMKQQNDFASIVDEMALDEDFLQAEMPSAPDGEFSVYYKGGNIPTQHEQSLEMFEARSLSRVRRIASKLSLKDAQDRGRRLATTLETKNFTSVSFSIDGDAIEFVAKKPANYDNGADQRMTKRAREARLFDMSDEDDKNLDDLTLHLAEYDDEDPAKPHHTYGGRKISGNGKQCTTAFSVVTSAGITGIATAAHCEKMNRFDAVPPESDYATYGQREHKGLYGDVEWHITSHWELPEYYKDRDARWPVRSVAGSVTKGQVVCGYSRMRSVRKCDRVYSTSVSVQYTGLPRIYNLVMMSGEMMTGGDSGGPWSNYDRAFGIHSGRMTVNGRKRDMWSRASYLPQALGVRVRTQ